MNHGKLIILIDFDNKINEYYLTNNVKIQDLEFIKDELTDYPNNNMVISLINDAIETLESNQK